jgi:hypothetical protein
MDVRKGKTFSATIANLQKQHNGGRATKFNLNRYNYVENLQRLFPLSDSTKIVLFQLLLLVNSFTGFIDLAADQHSD